MIYFAEGTANKVIDSTRISELIDSMLSKLGKLDRVIILSPDYTRYDSYAGEITCMLFDKLRDRSYIRILPTTGTHTPMTDSQIVAMYPSIPKEVIGKHDWRNDVLRVGTIPPDLTKELTDGLVDWPVHCDINRSLIEGKWDQIISVGQLVPHELIGIANHNKNILVGLGGKDIIGKTHMIGALYGTEKIMGQISSPVRDVLNYMSKHFIQHLPISYIMTVRGMDNINRTVTRGIFAGNDEECYLQGAKLCQQVNIFILDKAYRKVIAYLEPDKFKSVWVGNKAMLRTRMCIADGGELIILCPGIQSFGENPETDSFIRKYGYRDKEELLRLADERGEMEQNMIPLSQMILSDTERRFKVIYAAKRISKEEIESVHCLWMNYDEAIKKYNPSLLNDGENIMPDGEEIYYVSKPAMGLWQEINRLNRS